MNPSTALFAAGLILSTTVRAEIKLPAVFGDHMVLQQRQADPVWGWDTPGTKVTVTYAEQQRSTVTTADGSWRVTLAPMPATSAPGSLVVSGSSRKEFHDVVVGEVWVCAGQSNMEFPLRRETNGDLEAAAAQNANLRLISVPRLGTQDPQSDFKAQWAVSDAQAASAFSAIGFLYGIQLQRILRVPVGMINISWGGARAEAFIPRPALERNPRFKTLMDETITREARLLSDNGKADYASAMAKWKADVASAHQQNRSPPAQPLRFLDDRDRAGNIYAGMVHPLVGYGIKGVIWYQGEQNVGRPAEYRDLFPYLIAQWRQVWQQGDFPFYWVQLPNFHAEEAFAAHSLWAELREAQALALHLPNTGQAVAIDLGEANDIHPHNKQQMASRLVRWPLAKDYGINVTYRSPELEKVDRVEGKVLVTFECFGSKLRLVGSSNARGFAIADTEGTWHPANARLTGENTVELSFPGVANPVAIRYAWADNPICNLYSESGLPVTPFRTVP